MPRVAQSLVIVAIFLNVSKCTADDVKAEESRVKEALEKLRSVDPQVRWQGTVNLYDLPFDLRPHRKLVVPQLIRAFSDPEETVRRSAAWAIHRIGSDATEAIPALIALVDDPEPQERPNAVSALSMFESRAKDAVPVLVTFLKSEKSARQRRNACRALQYIGENADLAIPALAAAAAEDSDVSVREEALVALWKFNKLTKEVKVALLKRMKDESPVIRREAINLASYLKLDPDIFLPVLKAATLDCDHDVQDATFSALGTHGEKAVPIFIDYLDQNDSEVRYLAALQISFLGQHAGKAQGKLIDLLKHDPEARVRARAAIALAQIDGPVKERVTCLRNALKDRDKQVRIRAKESLDLIATEKSKE